MMQQGFTTPVRNDDGIISNPAPQCVPDPRGLGCAIYDKMTENRDFEAQIDGITGERDTFESLLQRCVRTALVMRSRGVTVENMVTICSYNHLNSCVPIIAGLFLGAKIACLDPGICLLETVNLLKLIRPKIIFVGAESIQLIENALRESEINTDLITFCDSATYPQFSEFLMPNPDEDNFRPLPIENIGNTAIIGFTGGTCGLPKSICLSHKALLSQSYEFSISRCKGLYVQDFHIQVTFATFYWISSITVLLISIYSKRTRAVVSKFDINRFWELTERIKVNVFYLVPSQAQLLCKRGRPKGVDISSLMQFVVTGGPVSKQLVEDLRLLVPGVDIRNLYALTEAGGHVASFRPHAFPPDGPLMRAKPDSCGRPRPGVSCKVVDNETGEILGPHQRGELRVKTNYQMHGYYDGDASNCWDSDGWLKTGDVCYYDDDNCFYIVDRVKEMLKFRSWYVYPAKLEGILHSHPAVEIAVVVGLPHPEDGDHPVGVVVLRSYAVGTVTGEDLEHYVAERVDDRHRLRGGVRIVEHIPLTPTGKPRRRDMKELVLSGEI